MKKNHREISIRNNTIAAMRSYSSLNCAENPPRCTAIYFSTHKIVERIVLVFSNIYRFGRFLLRCSFFRLLFRSSHLVSSLARSRVSFYVHGFDSFVWPILYCLVRIFHGFTVQFVLDAAVDIQVNKSMMNFSLRKRGGFKYHACSIAHLFRVQFQHYRATTH